MNEKVVKLDPIDPTRSAEVIVLARQISPAKRWIFTYNNYTEAGELDLKKELFKHSSKFYYGHEIGENGTPHLQGFVEFKTKVRPLSIITSKLIHWDKMKGSIEKNVEYCGKENRMIVTNMVFPEPIEIIDNLYEWQLEIEKIVLGKRDKRKIYWYWDEEGNSGKSALVKYLCVKYNAMISAGRASDMKYGIIKYHEKHHDWPMIILIDIPRSYIGYINWTGIEEIKNGCFASTKYESDMVIMNSPHIICFANSEPDETKLSSDRWVIKKIN